MMSRFLIVNAQVFDGTGAQPFRGDVLVEGNRITAVGKNGNSPSRDGAAIIEAAGRTLMPGLIEAHAHLGFGSTVDHLTRRRDLSLEHRLLLTVHAAQTLLDFGFTSAYSGGSANVRGEVMLRDAIAQGWLPGPRLKAASFEKSASAHKVDTTNTYPGIGGRECDVAGVRAFVEEMAEIGVDSVKFVVTGESGVVPGTSRVLQFYEAELAEAGRVARERGVYLTAHCHSAESVKMAANNGFRVLYHCTWADEAGLDLLEAKKDEIFVAPSPGINWANIHEGEAFGITKEIAEQQEQFVTLERVCDIMPKLHKRGVRVLPGGDYGFPWNPIGKNARDLELFVKLFGFTPAETLRAATKEGGELMDMGAQLGLIKEHYLADLLLIDGDPLADISVLQQRERLLMIMKDGKLHKFASALQPAAAQSENAPRAAPT